MGTATKIITDSGVREWDEQVQTGTETVVIDSGVKEWDEVVQQGTKIVVTDSALSIIHSCSIIYTIYSNTSILIWK